MINKVFYSWQSDLPNATNRGFIEKALEIAAKSIRDDNSIQVEPVVDRDTVGVPGAPDIASTILAKIEQSHVFVCDVSIINQNTQFRSTPNPNVLIELGYATKALGPSQIIMVMNTAFGGPELLPFDLRMKRVITYNMPQTNDDRATERKRLEKMLEQGLRAVFGDLDKKLSSENTQPSGDQARKAIEKAQPNQIIEVRRFMEWLANGIDSLAPDFTQNSELDELLIQGIDQTEELVLEFARLVEIIATINAFDAALEVYKDFDRIIERYNLPLKYDGSYRRTDFDLYKFVGHELFVTLFSFLVREHRWELIADLLENDIYIKNKNGVESGLVSFEYVCQHVELLDHRNDRLQLRRNSLHADILNKRHSQGDLLTIVPIQQFVGGDFFLFLRSGDWFPWSAVYMHHQLPRYLQEASREKYAQQLLRPLGVGKIETLRSLLEQRVSQLRQLFPRSFRSGPFWNFDPQQIGSK